MIFLKEFQSAITEVNGKALAGFLQEETEQAF